MSPKRETKPVRACKCDNGPRRQATNLAAWAAVRIAVEYLLHWFRELGML